MPSARAVCSAFTAAMRRYGVPFEVLTDNGKQFTGRHTRPQPVEALFERICRENGITQGLSRRYHRRRGRPATEEITLFGPETVCTPRATATGAR